MNLVGPITIAPMQIMSQKYSIRLFLYEEGGDSPLLDLLGFAAGKKGTVRLCNPRSMPEPRVHRRIGKTSAHFTYEYGALRFLSVRKPSFFHLERSGQRRRIGNAFVNCGWRKNEWKRKMERCASARKRLGSEKQIKLRANPIMGLDLCRGAAAKRATFSERGLFP